jgi:hypothetical protein
MPTTFDDVNAKCPFFGSSNNERIICEGVTDECISILKFDGKNSRMRHRAMFCDSNYEKCKLYKALEEKYDAQK